MNIKTAIMPVLAAFVLQAATSPATASPLDGLCTFDPRERGDLVIDANKLVIKPEIKGVGQGGVVHWYPDTDDTPTTNGFWYFEGVCSLLEYALELVDYVQCQASQSGSSVQAACENPDPPQGWTVSFENNPLLQDLTEPVNVGETLANPGGLNPSSSGASEGESSEDSPEPAPEPSANEGTGGNTTSPP